MSAFIVDGKTIDRIVSFLLDNVREFNGIGISYTSQVPWAQGVGTQIGQQLYRLNTDAVNSRYREGEESPGTRYHYTAVGRLSDIQAYKSIKCFLYQCSEGDVPERPLFIELSKVHGDLAHRIVCATARYDRAEWE
jgi:hypothetical protein